MASMAAMVGLAPTNAGPMRLFVYKYGALYQPAEIMSVTDTMTLDDVRREAARLLNLPVTKIDLVQLYVIVDHKYGRLTSIQQLCSNDNIVVSLRDEVGPADELGDTLDGMAQDGAAIYEVRQRTPTGKRKLAQRCESFAKMVETFQRYGADPKLKRSRVNSTWYEHRLFADAERLMPGFIRECDEERKKNRAGFTVRDARARAQKIIAELRKQKEEAASLS